MSKPDHDRQLVERLRRVAHYASSVCEATADADIRDVAHKAADALTRLLDERDRCAPYLKEGETPAECIARNRADVDTALGLLAKEKVARRAQEPQ